MAWSAAGEDDENEQPEETDNLRLVPVDFTEHNAIGAGAYRRAFESAVKTMSARFKPDAIVVSNGGSPIAHSVLQVEERVHVAG